MDNQLIFSGIEKLSLVDYDGVTACTLFLAGCNFRCPFCHNSVLVTGQGLPSFTEREVVNYLTKRKGLIEGVVITGGEPTLYDKLPEFVKKIRDMGFLVKLDTNGTNPDMIDSLISDGLDYVAMDIKNSKTNYSYTSGAAVDISSIQRSIDILMSRGQGYEFRTTIVKCYHSISDMRDIAQWLKGAKKYALQKFVDSGGCFEAGLEPISKEDALEYKAILSTAIANVILRGYE